MAWNIIQYTKKESKNKWKIVKRMKRRKSRGEEREIAGEK